MPEGFCSVAFSKTILNQILEVSKVNSVIHYVCGHVQNKSSYLVVVFIVSKNNVGSAADLLSMDVKSKREKISLLMFHILTLLDNETGPRAPLEKETFYVFNENEAKGRVHV